MEFAKFGEVLETQLAPHMDIHAEGVPEALNNLIYGVGKRFFAQGVESGAQIAETCFWEDDQGSTAPMSPSEIAAQIRATSDQFNKILNVLDLP